MYAVIVVPKAKKELARLSRDYQERVALAINMLGENPYIGKKLEGKLQGAWTFRVWPYRILYRIEREIVTVTVLRIAHRQGVYKK